MKMSALYKKRKGIFLFLTILSFVFGFFVAQNRASAELTEKIKIYRKESKDTAILDITNLVKAFIKNGDKEFNVRQFLEREGFQIEPNKIPIKNNTNQPLDELYDTVFFARKLSDPAICLVCDRYEIHIFMKDHIVTNVTARVIRQAL